MANTIYLNSTGQSQNVSDSSLSAFLASGNWSQTNPNVISGNSLQPTNTPLTTVPPPVDNTPELNASITGSASYLGQQNDAIKAAEAERQKLQTGQSDIMNQLLGKTADTQTAQQATGQTAAEKQIADLNTQAQALFREAQAIPLQIQQNAQNQGQTDVGVAPIQTSKLRDNAIKALSLAQQSDIATNNYNAAKAKADQIIALKYDPLEAQLKVLQQQYEFNKDNLTRIDAKRTEALNLALKKQEQDLADKKENAKAVENMLLQAQVNQAPNDILAKAQKIAKDGGSKVEIAKALGQYSLSSSERLDIQLKKLQISKAKQNLGGGGSSKLLSVSEAAAAGVPYGTTEAQLIAQSSGGGAINLEKAQASVANLDWLKNTAQKASNLSKGAGRTGIHEFVGGLFTLTQKKQLNGLSDSLKTNILTMAADPNIKKFFGPQMSEADVRMMTAAGTTLNPDTQTPAQYKEETSRIYDMFNRAQLAVQEGIRQEQLTSYINSSGTALQVTNSPFIK